MNRHADADSIVVIGGGIPKGVTTNRPDYRKASVELRLVIGDSEATGRHCFDGMSFALTLNAPVHDGSPGFSDRVPIASVAGKAGKIEMPAFRFNHQRADGETARIALICIGGLTLNNVSKETLNARRQEINHDPQSASGG